VTRVIVLAILAGTCARAQSCAELRPHLDEITKVLESRDIPQAERLRESLRGLSSTCPQIAIADGRVALAKGEYELAESYSEQALMNAPEESEALLFRGQILSMKGQVPAARELLEKACKLDPENARAHFQLGMLLDRIKRSADAVQQFEKAVKLRPDDPRGYDYLALNLERVGETAKAEAAYNQGLLVNNGPLFDGFLDYNYGRLLLKLDRGEESKAHLDRALQLAPQVRAVHYDHAKMNLRLGKLAEARQDAEQALKLADPSGFILDLQLYNLLLGICRRLGDGAAAQRYIDLARTATVPLRSRERD
jgi:tetratricopeptide (TPR) repeat protein